MVDAETTFLKLELYPTWEHIDDVRTFVQAFCLRGVPQRGKLPLTPGRAEAVSMTVHELLQNAVQNSCDGRSTVTLSVNRVTDEVRVVVENRAPRANLERLMALRRVLDQHEDDEALFLELMRGTAGKPGSGLGLGRIRYEGKMRLHIELIDDLVRVSARGAARGD